MGKIKKDAYFRIGVDIGTTNLKAILFNEDLKIIKQISKGYKTNYGVNGEAEQQVEDIFEAFIYCISNLIDMPNLDISRIKSINFSSAMHSLILANSNFELISQNIIWSDNRSYEDVNSFRNNYDWLNFYKKSGTPIHAMSPFSKLLWFKNNNLLDQVRYIFGIKEYIIHKLTNEFVIDFSVASATGLLNIHNLEWDNEILDFLNVDESYLPRLVDVDYEISVSKSNILQKIGLSNETNIVIGASDGTLANLGSGVIGSGKMTLTLGTSGAIRMTVEEPFLDSDGRIFCYYLKKDKWVIGGSLNNGGNTVDWLNSIIFQSEKEIYKHIDNAIKETEIGSNGLIFLPFLNGERAPYWNSEMTASFTGLKSFHTKNHLIRSLLEGVIMNLNNVKLLLQETSGEFNNEIYATGGFTNNIEWIKMIADIFGNEIFVQNGIEESCLGAVLLSYDDFVSPLNSDLTSYKANLDNHNKFLEVQRKYNDKINKIFNISDSNF